MALLPPYMTLLTLLPWLKPLGPTRPSGPPSGADDASLLCACCPPRPSTPLSLPFRSHAACRLSPISHAYYSACIVEHIQSKLVTISLPCPTRAHPHKRNDLHPTPLGTDSGHAKIGRDIGVGPPATLAPFPKETCSSGPTTVLEWSWDFMPSTSSTFPPH